MSDNDRLRVRDHVPRSGYEVRRQLQEAALKLYATQGYDQTTIADIAAMVGVTTRTFFRHFIDKREVFFDSNEAFCELIIRSIRVAPKELSLMHVSLYAFQANASFIEQNHSSYEPRHKVIQANSALHERALAKKQTIILAIDRAFIERGVSPHLATLTAEISMAAFEYAKKLWLNNPNTGFAVYLKNSFTYLYDIFDI